MASEGTISNLRKKRGAQRRSLNKLAEKVRDLEENPMRKTLLSYYSTPSIDWAQNTDLFKVIDLIDEEDESTL